MRCSCYNSGTYMVHAESTHLGGGCPDCGSRCKACLGTNTVMSREALKNLKNDPFALSQIFSETEEPKERFNPDEYGRE